MLVFRNVALLYDGSSAEKSATHSGVDLFVDGPTIHDLRPHDPALSFGDDHALVDASALTIVPGIVDCHGHVTVLGLDTASMDQMIHHSHLVYVERILYTSLVDGGVTTMRDVGGATHMMKRLVDDGVIFGPRLKISICMLSTTGGHADFRGPDRCHGELSKLWPGAEGRPDSIVDGPWECRKRVREIAACGADLIKICASPGVASPSDKLEHRDFSAEEIEAICDEASARGLRVAAHAHSQTGIEMAVRHGVHDIQHISFMDERLVEMAAEKQCTVTPTSWVTHELTKATGLSDFVMKKVAEVNVTHAAATRHAASGHLPILAGTDPVLPGMHGRNYLEISALMKEGLDPLAAWFGATGLAASEIGQADTGVLAPGRRADLLVCQGDVLNDPASMDKGALLEVIKDGFGYREGIAEVPQRTWRNSCRRQLWPQLTEGGEDADVPVPDPKHEPAGTPGGA